VGADSGEVSFSLIGASVHPSLDYVSFDFLREVMCSLTEGWVLLYIISGGVNCMVGIAFLVWAMMTCVRLCPSSVQRSAEYSSQP
jgi:hypothetical protein